MALKPSECRAAFSPRRSLLMEINYQTIGLFRKTHVSLVLVENAYCRRTRDCYGFALILFLGKFRNPCGYLCAYGI